MLAYARPEDEAAEAEHRRKMEAYAQADAGMRWPKTLKELARAALFDVATPKHFLDFANNRSLWDGEDVGALTDTPGWSFTRASSAYYENGVGGVTLFGSGELRRGSRGAQFEPFATNLCLHAADLTQAAWTKTNGTAAKDQLGPDGSANSASSFTATSANATVLQTVVSASATRAAGAYLRRLVGEGTVEMTVDGGATWTAVAVTSTWTRFRISQAAVTNPNFGIRLATSGDSVAFWAGQIESTSQLLSSPIITGGATASRQADLLSIASPGVACPCSLWQKFERLVDTNAVEVIQALDDNSLANYVRVQISTAERAQAQMGIASASQGTATVTSTLGMSTVYKAAARFQADSFRAACNGVLGAEDTGTGGNVPATPTHWRLAGSATGAPFGGFISQAALVDRVLTNDELMRSIG